MAQYHDYLWWINQFKGKELKFKRKLRPAKSLEEAREFVAFYEKRGGGSANWKVPMQKAFTEAYGEPYMSPAEHEIYMLRKEKERLEQEIAEQKASLVEKKVEPKVVVEALADEPPALTKEQFKEKWCKDRGYGSVVSLTQPEKMKLGRAWSKYPNKIEG